MIMTILAGWSSNCRCRNCDRCSSQASQPRYRRKTRITGRPRRSSTQRRSPRRSARQNPGAGSPGRMVIVVSAYRCLAAGSAVPFVIEAGDDNLDWRASWIAELINPMWLNACGKFPKSSPVQGSTSSPTRPRSLAQPHRRSKSSRARSSCPVRARLSTVSDEAVVSDRRISSAQFSRRNWSMLALTCSGNGWADSAFACALPARLNGGQDEHKERSAAALGGAAS